jgi:hypothetical protein
VAQLVKHEPFINNVEGSTPSCIELILHIISVPRIEKPPKTIQISHLLNEAKTIRLRRGLNQRHTPQKIFSPKTNDRQKIFM